MDPVTHALAGAAIADALPSGEKFMTKGLVFGMAMAVLPDADILVSLAANPYTRPLGFYSMFNPSIHRAYSHAFFIQAAAGVILGWCAWRLLGKTGRPAEWIALTVLAFFSHTLLDMTNSWGTRIWLPFSDARFSWSAARVVDPPSFITFGLCFICNRKLFANRKEKSAALNTAGRIGAWLNMRIISHTTRAGLARLALTAVASRIAIAVVMRSVR